MRTRNLFYCNTTYQFLFCLNIVLMRTAGDANDIILSDRTDFTQVAENLTREKIFDNVTVIRPKEGEALYAKKGASGRMRERIHHFSAYLSPLKWLKKEYGLELPRYDAIYACNMTDHALIEIYAALALENKDISFYEIEDGYGTYVRPLRYYQGEHSFKQTILSILRYPFLTAEKITKSLLYFPELYLHEDSVPKEQMPLMDLSAQEIQGLMQRIFGCCGFHLQKRYIIMEESFKADGEVNNSEQLFTEVVDMVGKDNIMLKTHPRNGRNSYHERDIEVYDEPVAWEALIATENVDDKVLVTCTCGTAVNTKLLYGSKCKVIYLYKLLEGDASSVFKSPYTITYLERFREKYSDEVFVPSTHEELRQVIDRIEAEARG